MARILDAIKNMNLDGEPCWLIVEENFIDVKPFNEGKQILMNAIDDLYFYLDMFKKGDLSKFPVPTVLVPEPPVP